MTSRRALGVLLSLGLWLVAPLTSASAAASAPNAEASYASARESYYALKKDAARRKLRHHWLRVADRFEKVAEKFPKSPRAPEALFTAAQMYEDLSRISLLGEDRLSAAQTYGRMVTLYPRHRLADDAALALGKLQIERLNKLEAGRRTLRTALKQHAKGDRAKEIESLLASLPAPAPAPPSTAVAASSPTVSSVPRAASPLPSVSDVTPAVPIAGIASASSPSRRGESASRANLLKNLKARADAGEPTLAQQLGLKMRRVVIDPGHGGHDSGALGPSGIKEKDVALAISQKLATILDEAGLETVLTRDEDTFVALEDRTQRANSEKGDLFVSIHCNAAASSKLRGVETYSLNVSSNRYAIRLAARENAASERGMSDLQFILADLATKVNTDESRRLAGRVQSQLTGDLGDAKDLGTKEALFYVLLGAKMPAILVETSFLSNPEEESLLSSPAHQEKIARSIARGIEAFLGDRDRVAQMN